VEEDAHPLRSCCASTVGAEGARLRNVVCAGGDGRGEVGGVGAGGGYEDVFEEGGWGVGVVEGGCGEGYEDEDGDGKKGW
jgi:hypothetical protein